MTVFQPTDYPGLGLVIFLIGACLGSFLNVVIYRLPRMLMEAELPQTETGRTAALGLAFPRSFCPQCHTGIEWKRNIPILSYIVQRGRSACCNKRISVDYFIVELSSAGLLCVLAYTFGIGLQFLFFSVLLLCLIALAAIDLKHYLLPDSLTLGLLWLGLGLNALNFLVPASQAIGGAVLGYLLLWLPYKVHLYFSGRHGMGFGDFKLLAALGAWFGPLAVALALLIASLSGLIYALVRVASNKQGRSDPIPFGPHLTLPFALFPFVSPERLLEYIQNLIW